MGKKSVRLLNSIKPVLIKGEKNSSRVDQVGKWEGILAEVLEMKRIQDQFVQKYGEPAYTTCQIEMMLSYSGHPKYSSDRIYSLIKKNTYLEVSQDDLKTFTHLRGRKHFVRKSNLLALMDKMKVSVTIDQLEEAAKELGYRV
jgi:hypothetical protein